MRDLFCTVLFIVIAISQYRCDSPPCRTNCTNNGTDANACWQEALAYRSEELVQSLFSFSSLTVHVANFQRHHSTKINDSIAFVERTFKAHLSNESIDANLTLNLFTSATQELIDLCRNLTSTPVESVQNLPPLFCQFSTCSSNVLNWLVLFIISVLGAGLFLIICLVEFVQMHRRHAITIRIEQHSPLINSLSTTHTNMTMSCPIAVVFFCFILVVNGHRQLFESKCKRECNTEQGTLDCWKATTNGFTYGLATSMIDYCQVILQVHRLADGPISWYNISRTALVKQIQAYNLNKDHKQLTKESIERVATLLLDSCFQSFSISFQPSCPLCSKIQTKSIQQWRLSSIILVSILLLFIFLTLFLYAFHMPFSSRQALLFYETLKGRDVRYLGDDVIYWDIVLVTALDNVQKDAYDALIRQRSTINRIPLGIDYLVVADPGKIGNGGSTMHAMHILEELYGWEDLRQKRILLIHAGGYSQRTPTSSCLGKIATSIPKGWPAYDLLDIKLALYSLFPARMPNGGVFLSSSDTIELFDETDSNVDWFLTDDFVAFAHPSSLPIGTQHGVYVLDPLDNGKCVCVLQKPTIDQIRSHKAVRCHGEEEFVYTDSLYYFNLNVAQRLTEIYRHESHIRCEIDCYGDFMSPLGTRPLPRPSSTTTDQDDHPQRTRLKQKIYDALLGCHLQVIILEKSSFNHTGTNDEYLDICCGHGSSGQEVFNELEFEKNVGLKVFDEGRHDTIDFWHGVLPALPHGDTLHYQPTARDVLGCVIHSFVHLQCRTPRRSLLEYCCLGIPIDVGENSILSNITLVTSSDSTRSIIQLPSNLIMQTVPLGQEQFATFAFGYNDNMKGMQSNADDMLYFGQSLSAIALKLDCHVHDLFEDENNKSLWTLRVFPVTNNPSESFEQTLKLISTNQRLSLQRLVSIKDILKDRHISTLLHYRSNLINCT